MAGRGPQTFKKRQKEQQRKERQLEKIAKRLKRKSEPHEQSDSLDDAPAPDDTEPSSAPTDGLSRFAE